MSLPEPTTTSTQSEPEKKAPADPLRLRYRVRFAKTGLLRWTSHRDLARLWERLVRRAQLHLSMTEGFHPKPRIGFPSALALGVSGIDEVVELDLAERLSASELMVRLAHDGQPGLEIKSVQLLPEGSGKAKLERTDYVITTPDPDLGADELDVATVQANIRSLLQQQQVTVERKKKPLTVSVAEQIVALEFDQTIQLSLAASDAATLKPIDVLDLIGCSDWISHGSQITRTEVVLKQEFETTDPEFLAIANQTPFAGDSTQEVSK
jgi:radical SAM-linked protein